MSARIVDKKLVLNGFVYYRGKVRKNKQHWECKRYRLTRDCTARATTNLIVPGGEIIVLAESQHEHPPNHNEVAAEKVKEVLKRKADEHPEQPPAQLLRTALGGVRQGK